MSKKQGILYIFDLQNTQAQYAQCLEFISILQHCSTMMEDPIERIRQLSRSIDVSGIRVPDHAKNYYEEPLISNTGEIQPTTVRAKKLIADYIRASILAEPGSMRFHLRIHLQNAGEENICSLANLHYLALLLQRLDQLLSVEEGQVDETGGLDKRVSVFIVPQSADRYPFQDQDGNVDLDTYQTVSSYLRLLSRRYTGIIYGVVQRKAAIIVRALDFHRTARLTDYFPLIPLDQKTYWKLFERTVSPEMIDTLFSLRKHGRYQGRFPDADQENLAEALDAFILETAYYQMKSTLSESDEDGNLPLLHLLRDELRAWSEREPVYLLSFTILLFTFRFNRHIGISPKIAIRQSMEFASELSAGLRQLAQNTLQHSASQKGVFSFYREKHGETVHLRIFLSDFNDQQTFIENFISNIRREAEHTDDSELKARYAKLCEQKDFITLGYFFGEYGATPPGQAWIDFRRSDISAHIGLLLFSLTMQRCHGIVQLVNSKDYSVQAQDCFCCRYDGDQTQLSPNFSGDPIIPGTHLALAVPVGAIEETRPIGLGQLSMAQSIQETYDAFAAYLDYQPQKLDFPDEAFQRILREKEKRRMNIFTAEPVADAEVKYEMIHCWERYWVQQSGLPPKSAENRVIYLSGKDLPQDRLTSADEIEIFLKGFLNAMDVLCRDGRSLLLAFTDMPPLFLQVFRQITISLALKGFPPMLQLYVIGQDSAESIHLLGNTFCQAIVNAYTLSLERGTQAYSAKDVARAKRLYSKLGQDDVAYPSQAVCPFDAILPSSGEQPLSLFDRQIRTLAERPLDKPPAGYKLENTHMRLGSKVHIRAFYEMAFLFYRTSISNRIAFELLRNLKKGENTVQRQPVDFLHDNLIFYGYASYSKALLTSILEILKAYRIACLTQRINAAGSKEKLALKQELLQIPEHLAYVSYQHNLQSDFQVEDTELYFSFSGDTLGIRLDKNRVRFDQPVKIIQIVPISSTLTTFDKMEARIQTAVEHPDKKCGFETAARYTVFWVTDKQAHSLTVPREETEAKYWNRVDLAKRQIFPQPKPGHGDTAPIVYFMRSPVVWEDPLQCALCYPDNMIAEVPVVETDQTSTVPAQQLRGYTPGCWPVADHAENDRRLIQLRSCITYGHIRREKNHFQFYLETQNYFNQVSKDVQRWLEGLREKDYAPDTSLPVVFNIIFSPEHATNVGFAQYVNNYYFGGNAEIVCVNEEKEYRSNFKCEHMALSRTIEDLLDSVATDSGFQFHPLSYENLPVRFYFVDDTIITGETFHKAVGFLHSLIPARYQYLFPTNLIHKCFLLVDRLSKESKRIYVTDTDKDFLSFLHIDLSNMRIQGDSCVGCKLEMNAKKLLRRSATRTVAGYWTEKARCHKVQGYSRCSASYHAGDRAKAFRKLTLSHITQNVLFNDNEFFELGDIYDSFLTIIANILGDFSFPGANFQYDLLMEELRGTNSPDPHQNDIELLQDFIKLISRPFFSFDFKVKLQALTLLLIFSESLIGGDQITVETLEECEPLRSSPYKSFLFKNRRIPRTFQLLQKIKSDYLSTKDAQIVFFQDCLMDSLVEMHSTYMMRKDTMSKLIRFLMINDPENGPWEHSKAAQFWRQYVAGIHQILDRNNDETRALWLEHLLLSGEEYRAFQEKYPDDTFEPRSLFQALATGTTLNRDSAFFHFCNELFLQNNRVLFDGIENHLVGQDLDSDNSINYWRRGRALDRFRTGFTDETPSQEEQDLFNALKESSESYKVTGRYKSLLDSIVAMARKKYGFKRIDIALITYTQDGHPEKREPPEISHLDLVSCNLSSTLDSHFNKYEIKRKLVQALSESDGLTYYGYQVSQKTETGSSYFFIYFDSEENPIVPVYLYLSASALGKHGDFDLMLLLRDILSYRHRLLRILKNDFASDVFAKYAHTAGEKSILAHEKATSHNTTGDDSVTLDIFMDPKSTSRYSVLDPNQVLKWLLLHNYTNAQIAKLFSRSYRTAEGHDSDGNFPSPPPLYLENVDGAELKTRSLFERPLRTFSDLRLLEDGRIAMLDAIVSLKLDKIKDIKFLKNDKNQFYNVEYFKNILIDIIITAMKYGTVSATYLERVDKYLEGAAKLQHQELLTKEQANRFRKGQCRIECSTDNADDPEAPFLYLVIRNNVNRNAHNLFDWETHNQSIRARLESPLDHADGHMSLLAISQYIEGLWPKMLHRKTTFAYIELEGELWFETKLPIVGKE